MLTALARFELKDMAVSIFDMDLNVLIALKQALRPVYSRKEIDELRPEHLAAVPLVIDVFYCRRIYSSNLFEPPTYPLQPYDHERTFVTTQYLHHFPRERSRISLFVPAPAELYPEGTFYHLRYDEDGVCTSGEEFFVCWGLWEISQDLNYKPSLEQLTLMPPLARNPIACFGKIHRGSINFLEQHLICYTLHRVPARPASSLVKAS